MLWNGKQWNFKFEKLFIESQYLKGVFLKRLQILLKEVWVSNGRGISYNIFGECMIFLFLCINLDVADKRNYLIKVQYEKYRLTYLVI